MDIEKLIETLRQHGVSCVRAYGRYCSICDEAASALSTLQAENSRLRAELEYEREHANAYYEECGQWEAENEKLRAELKSKVDLVFQQTKELYRKNLLLQEQKAELEQAKRERDAIEQDFCVFTKQWSEEESGFPCRWCKYENTGRCEWKESHPTCQDECFGKFFEWREPHKED